MKHERILIVDDEALVRMLSADALSERGYRVVEAGSAVEAIETLERYGDVQVLFTDIRMPGQIDGLQLATIVNERWPDIKLLLTSGDTRPSKSDVPDDGHFIAKPYRLEQLQTEVDNLLRGP